ncbi:Methyltransferase-like protein [Ooceraea biroi]|uniref:U6 small nuclear RNA (adenine-(43)-N(6))-methyltransferase n=1 Tax=Ooceraea biroi TaxID=2015173 RepID=A0A026W4L4_OOCBI|nr:Methyltransferase-like protein [Ooceraea biroi]
MSVRRYIHPRNKYKTPPDYKKLAIKYPEFRQIAITDLAGRVRIDFQNEKSLRTLTETLLMHDFGLLVRIPPDKLNPTITLRMNYILWIEDLMNHLKLKMDKVTGIDIGTGATCIYALLLAKIYGCHMIGTEVDEASVEHARDCIQGNNLENLIKVITVNAGRIFKDVIESNDAYDFSMCNPPFFESADDDAERIAKALPPRNASTGNASELKTVGGEWAFVAQMIDESIELRDRIKVYSTMVGRKTDLMRLKQEIVSRGTTNVTWTEFCQGHTTRWGLAWSFLPRSVVDLTTAPVIRKSGKSIVQSVKNTLKKETSITFPIGDEFSCMDDLISFLTTTVKQLNVTLYRIPVCKDSFNGWMCRIVAKEKSWEHARRKRRLALRQTAPKRLDDGGGKCIEETVNDKDTSDAIAEGPNDTGQANKNSDATSTIITVEGNNAEGASDESSEEKVLDERIPVLTCKLCVETRSSECDEDDVFRIWMVYENGSGGLDALHSLRQYLINRLGVRGKILDNSSKDSKKQRRKKARKDVAGTSFAVPTARPRTVDEDSSRKGDTGSSDDR